MGKIVSTKWGRQNLETEERVTALLKDEPLRCYSLCVWGWGWGSGGVTPMAGSFNQGFHLEMEAC